MCFIHLCSFLCSPPVVLILQHSRLTQDQPSSLQSTHFSCLLGGLHLCSPPLVQPPLVILLALQTPPDLVCHIVSLLLTLKCQFASLGGVGVVCHPLENTFTGFVHSPSVVSHIWKELPGSICKPSHAPCFRKLQQSSLSQRNAETRYWPCSSFLLLPDLLSVLQFLFCVWTAPSPVRA